MTWFLTLSLIAAVLTFGYFVIRHRDEFERLFRSDVEKVKDEAKEAEDKFRAAMKKFDDEARESLTQKVKKARARRRK